MLYLRSTSSYSVGLREEKGVQWLEIQLSLKYKEGISTYKSVAGHNTKKGTNRQGNTERGRDAHTNHFSSLGFRFYCCGINIGADCRERLYFVIWDSEEEGKKRVNEEET